MKKHSRFTKSLAIGALVSSVAVVTAIGGIGRVSAIGNPDIQPIEFGLLSLTRGQTARLNVVNPVLTSPPEPDTPEQRVQLGFDIYAVGDVEDAPNPTVSNDSLSRLTKLRFLGRLSRTVTLRPGEAASFDFTATEAGTHVSAVMLGGPDTSRAIGNPDIVPTLSVMEGARTIYTHPAFVKGFNPQPDPPGISGPNH